MASLPKLPDYIKTRKEINLEIHFPCLDNGGHYIYPTSSAGRDLKDFNTTLIYSENYFSPTANSALLAALDSAGLVVSNVSENTMAQVVAGAFGSIMVYIVVEVFVDATTARA